MKTLTYLIMIFLLALALTLSTNTLIAQDLMKVALKNTKVLLENDRVRVLEYQAKPGEKAAMHSHPANVVYALSSFKTKFTLPDGKTQEVETKAGQANWSEASTHASENVGTTEAHALIIELKEPSKKK